MRLDSGIHWKRIQRFKCNAYYSDSRFGIEILSYLFP